MTATPLEVGQGVLAPASPRPLVQSVSWTLAGNIVYALCQWCMLAALAKKTDAATVGRFALGLSVCAPVFMFTNLQLRGAQATDVSGEFRFAHYFSLRCVASLLGVIFIAAVTLATRIETKTAMVIGLVAISKAVESLSDVIAGLFQRHERLDRAAVSLIMRGAFSLLTFLILLLWRRDLIVCLEGTIVAWAIVLVAFDVQKAKRIRSEAFVSIERKELIRLARLSAPLGVTMTLSSLTMNVPRYVLASYAGAADLGIFASIAAMMIAASFVANAVGQSTLVRLSVMFAKGDIVGFEGLLRKSVLLGVGIGMGGTLIALVFGREIVARLYRPEYAENVQALVVLAGGSGVWAIASFLGFGMTACRSFKQQVPIAASSAIVCFLGSVILIPQSGMTGAAYGLLITGVVQAALTAVFLRRAAARVARV